MQTVDLFLFAGQSNMAGRGAVCERFPETAPPVLSGAGWEYRAISAPDRLSPLREPFGKDENNPSGIHESIKTGSMVSSFVNAYYLGTNIPVVGVSASKGGSVQADWQPDKPYLTDALHRLGAARDWLIRNDYRIRHIFVLWCQGESDGDAGTEREAYLRGFDRMLCAMLRAGAERLFLVRIGHCNAEGGSFRYAPVMAWQEEIAERNGRVVPVSRCFASMRERGLIKDAFHYYQAAYNEAGREAGENAAAWVNRHLESEKNRENKADRITGTQENHTDKKTEPERKTQVKTKHVTVEPYSRAWANHFNSIRNEIGEAMGGLALRIEHVGSTSVPGLSAKPIIDIDVVIRDESVLEEAVCRLETIGYRHEGNLGIEGREAFRYDGKDHLQKHHLYVCTQDSAELKRHTAFRDYLRSHPEAVREYSRIKEEGAALYPDDIEKYIGHKSPFIERIYREIGL